MMVAPTSSTQCETEWDISLAESLALSKMVTEALSKMVAEALSKMTCDFDTPAIQLVDF